MQERSEVLLPKAKAMEGELISCLQGQQGSMKASVL
jgi:hypothetical protein